MAKTEGKKKEREGDRKILKEKDGSSRK